MGFTPREYRAIQAVAMRNGYRLMLCRKPWVYFQDKMGTLHKWRIGEVLRRYDSFQKTASRVSTVDGVLADVRG